MLQEWKHLEFTCFPGGFKHVYVHAYLGKIPILTIQMGWNQPVFFPQSREPFRVSEAEHLGPLPFKCFNVFDTINWAKKERFVFSYTYIYTI